MASSGDDSLAQTLLRFHELLVAGDPSAPAALAEALLPLVIKRLGWLSKEFNNSSDLESLAGLSIARYLRDPSKFDPAKGPLLAYIIMDVKGDASRELERESLAAKQTVSGEFVVIDEMPGKYQIEDLTEVFDTEARVVLDEICSSLDETDRSVFGLMLERERSTAAYAAVLGITHLPMDVQAKAVKRNKDRLQKRASRMKSVKELAAKHRGKHDTQ